MGKSSSRIELCGNCKHWKVFPDPDGDLGRCTVLPPIINGTLAPAAPAATVEMHTFYPVTKRTEASCDEFDD